MNGSGVDARGLERLERLWSTRERRLRERLVEARRERERLDACLREQRRSTDALVARLEETTRARDAATSIGAGALQHDAAYRRALRRELSLERLRLDVARGDLRDATRVLDAARREWLRERARLDSVPRLAAGLARERAAVARRRAASRADAFAARAATRDAAERRGPS